MLLCISLAYWAFTEFMYRQADTPDTAYLWIKANFLWYFSIAFLIHFALIYTEKTKVFKNKLIYLLIYGPALLFFCVELATNTTYVEPVKEFWGYTYGISEDSLVYWMSTIWAVAVGFFTLILCSKYYLKVTDTRKKQQAKFAVLGFSIPVFLGSLTEMLLPALEIKTPELTVISLTGLCIFVGYAVYKYKLFVLTTETASESIIDAMTDSLVLVDKNEKIIKVNPSLLNLLGYNEIELVGQSMNKLFVEEQFGKDIIKKLLEREPFDNYETKYKTKSGEEIDISFSGSLVRTEEGNIVGFVGIAHNITERKKMEEQLQEKTNELQKKSDHLESMNLDLNSMNQELTATNEELLAMQEKLKIKIDEMEKYKTLTINRELRMIELKKEVDELCKKFGEKLRYDIEIK